jgi:hypothetical protein
MIGRHTGVVCRLDPETNDAEIRCPGMQDVNCNFSDLHRVGANQIGAVVDFELGAFRGAVSGAVNITKRAP